MSMVTSESRLPRLTDMQRTALLDRLDQLETGRPMQNRRSMARMKYRKADVPLHVEQPGGGTIDCTVATRNLGATGASFLYPGFLHADTLVRLVLTKRKGESEMLTGKVAWCRHIFGPHHLVGVRFSKNIAAQDFVEPADLEQSAEVKIDPRQVTGKILLVDDQEIDRMLFQHHMKSTKLQVSMASTAAEAVELFKKEKFDLLLCDLNLAEMTGEEALALFSKSGFTGKMLVITAETSSERLMSAMKAGAAAVVQKPYSAESLIETIAQWLSGGGADAIFSELAGKPGIEALLKQYVTQVQSLAEQLRTQVDSNNLDMARKICQTLKGTGSGYGYSQLTETATKAIKALESTASLPNSMTELSQLQGMCKRLSAGKP